jgi:hypothetical protein
MKVAMEYNNPCLRSIKKFYLHLTIRKTSTWRKTFILKLEEKVSFKILSRLPDKD